MAIRLRLAIWYSSIFASVFVVFSALLYILMARHLTGMVDETIARRAQTLAAAIHAEEQTGQPESQLIIPNLDAFEEPEVYIQILRPNGEAVARSSNLEGRTVSLPSDGLTPSQSLLFVNGTFMRSTLEPVLGEIETIAWVQVTASYRQRDFVLQRLRWTLVGAGLGAMALVGILSSVLAGRVLRPVSEMTETARAIALSKGFNRRLSAGSSGDELGQLATTFNEMLASLEEAYGAQQRFTADASHELRAPLTTIRGNLDLLALVKDMPEAERHEVLDTLRREAERMGRLVDDLLTLARADAGQLIRTQPIELDALVLECYRQAQVMAQGLNMRLGHLQPAVVQGDGDRLKQLLLILVDNAIRYTPTGGTITLSIESELGWVSVGVEDTGIGIEPQDLTHIFERFWRAAKARSRDSGGTGLGLAIAKWIVDQHGGEILVDSVPGKGTRFAVRLPAAS